MKDVIQGTGGPYVLLHRICCHNIGNRFSDGDYWESPFAKLKRAAGNQQVGGNNKKQKTTVTKKDLTQINKRALDEEKATMNEMFDAGNKKLSSC